MIASFSDGQIAALMDAVKNIAPEKRAMFMDRVGKMAALAARRDGRISDIELLDIARRASAGLCCKLRGPRDPQNVSLVGKGRYVGASKRWAGLG
jgi:hypothetical protein